MSVNKILSDFLNEHSGLLLAKAGDESPVLQISEASKRELLEKFLQEKNTNNYILVVVVLMFISLFALGCYLTLYYREQPDTLKVVFGGTFLSLITVVYGLQRLWRQKSYCDYLILLIQNLPANQVAEIIQTIIFETKRKKN